MEIDGQQVVVGARRGGRAGGRDALGRAAAGGGHASEDDCRQRNQLHGTIEEVHFLGSVVRIRVRFKENAVSLDTFNNPNAPPPERGQPVTVSFAREDLLVLEGAEPT